MIVAAIIILAGVVISQLVTILTGIPTFNLTMMSDTFTYIFPYLVSGMKFFNSFVYVSAVQAMLAITVAVEAILIDYKLVMWVATKIPMFGVSD